MIVTGATNSLQAAAFPQFCRIRDTPEELRRSVLSCFRTASILSIPALAGLAVISKPLLSILGNKWAGASTAMVILSVAAMVQPVAWFTAPLLQSVPDALFGSYRMGHAISLAVDSSRCGVSGNDTVRGQVVVSQLLVLYHLFLFSYLSSFGCSGTSRVFE